MVQQQQLDALGSRAVERRSILIKISRYFTAAREISSLSFNIPKMRDSTAT